MSSLDLKLDLNNSFGALLLGVIISSMYALAVWCFFVLSVSNTKFCRLYGAMCLQSWHYFQNYSDGAFLKSAVSVSIPLAVTQI
jgi:hypothetical protein